MPVATVTSKGQITLPKEVREHLHIGEGDRLEFLIDESGEVRVRPVAGSVEAFFEFLRGLGSPARSLEEIEERMIREIVADDERIRRNRRRG